MKRSDRYVLNNVVEHTIRVDSMHPTHIILSFKSFVPARVN